MWKQNVSRETLYGNKIVKRKSKIVVDQFIL